MGGIYLGGKRLRVTSVTYANPGGKLENHRHMFKPLLSVHHWLADRFGVGEFAIILV